MREKNTSVKDPTKIEVLGYALDADGNTAEHAKLRGG